MARPFDSMLLDSTQHLLIFETLDDFHDKAFRLWAKKLGIQYREMIGKYKGQFNRAFLARMYDYDRLYPWFVNQESILVLEPADDTYFASLVYMKTGVTEHIGQWQEIPASQVSRYEGATLDPISGRWFTTSGTKRVHRVHKTNFPDAYLVSLDNDEGVQTIWPVHAEDEQEAFAEAWADYRELRGGWDGDMPPEWTHAHLLGV